MRGIGDRAEAEHADQAGQAQHQPDQHHHQHPARHLEQCIGCQPLIQPDMAEQAVEYAGQATEQARPTKQVLGRI
ncbi:hypothetical protein D9M73_244520 [compost metagenome]